MKRPIDHVTVSGPVLETVRDAFESAGFETTYGGEHSNGSTHMHVVGFENRSYIELISKKEAGESALWDDQIESALWDDQIESAAGATAWAISVDDIDQRSDELADRGFEIEGPTELARDRPDGTHVEWELSVIDGRPKGTPTPMLLMDQTPVEWRANTTMAADTSGLLGLTDVVIGTDRFADTVETLRTFYGDAGAIVRRETEFGARVASIAETPVSVAEPLDDGS